MEEFKKILSSFQVKDTLNPKIWTNVDNEEQSKMHPEVREALLAIANEFIEFLNVDIFVSDVTMTGSLANYNWSDFSDVDLHIMYNFDEAGEFKEIYKELFKMKKTLFNSTHDIQVKGYEVELYVQDSSEQHISSGVYSVLFDEWINEPSLEEVSIDERKIKEKVEQWMDIIDITIDDSDDDDFQSSIKMIEKITYAAGLLYYIGATPAIKLSRQSIIKNIIDLVELQFKTLYSKDSNVRKKRNENASIKYGFNKDLSNLFFFKIENDIFTYSSKETDKFKLFKLNNINCYLIFFLINDLSDIQIQYLNYDKLVNYFIFDKFGYSLFDNLLIRINNSDVLQPIKKYKVLCYVIYYLTGILVKYNMWFSDTIEYKPNNINIQLHRIAVHTFIDLLNSILETNAGPNKTYLYEMFSGKFYQIIKNIYNNVAISDNIIKNLETQTKKKITFKFLTPKQEKELETIRNSASGVQVAPVNTKRLEMMIKSIDGNSDQMAIYQFIQNLPIKDSQDFKRFVADNRPNLDLIFEVQAPSGDKVRVRLDFGVEFFRPFFGL